MPASGGAAGAKREDVLGIMTRSPSPTDSPMRLRRIPERMVSLGALTQVRFRSSSSTYLHAHAEMLLKKARVAGHLSSAHE